MSPLSDTTATDVRSGGLTLPTDVSTLSGEAALTTRTTLDPSVNESLSAVMMETTSPDNQSQGTMLPVPLIAGASAGGVVLLVVVCVVVVCVVKRRQQQQPTAIALHSSSETSSATEPSHVESYDSTVTPSGGRKANIYGTVNTIELPNASSSNYKSPPTLTQSTAPAYGGAEMIGDSAPTENYSSLRTTQQQLQQQQQQQQQEQQLRPASSPPPSQQQPPAPPTGTASLTRTVSALTRPPPSNYGHVNSVNYEQVHQFIRTSQDF